MDIIDHLLDLLIVVDGDDAGDIFFLVDCRLLDYGFHDVACLGGLTGACRSTS